MIPGEADPNEFDGGKSLTNKSKFFTDRRYSNLYSLYTYCIPYYYHMYCPFKDVSVGMVTLSKLSTSLSSINPIRVLFELELCCMDVFMMDL